VPILVEKYPFSDQIPAFCQLARDRSPQSLREDQSRYVNIGLVNNMPDCRHGIDCAAVPHAAGNGRPRYRDPVEAVLDARRTLQRLATSAPKHLLYGTFMVFGAAALDGLIVTGTEPRAPDLADEPYWTCLSESLSGPKTTRSRRLWSCLAAHAAVLLSMASGRSPPPREMLRSISST